MCIQAPLQSYNKAKFTSWQAGTARPACVQCNSTSRVNNRGVNHGVQDPFQSWLASLQLAPILLAAYLFHVYQPLLGQEVAGSVRKQHTSFIVVVVVVFFNFVCQLTA